MARFYREYLDIEIVQTLSAQITWSHNLEILRVESKEQRLWYINKTIENGWSVNVLTPNLLNIYSDCSLTSGLILMWINSVLLFA
ncbi:MAG: hypothetical protein J6K18_04460 [Bacilli bacterium]|nr:hypothetical protein [Bacilli bacterium]